MWPVDFIEEKRDGKEQSTSRIKKFIEELYARPSCGLSGGGVAYGRVPEGYE